MPDNSDNITIITMADMAVVFSVTDDFGIHRESVSVELAREDPGEVSVSGGQVENHAAGQPGTRRLRFNHPLRIGGKRLHA